jgi:NAD(P)-dependent dehydrogenase (short-subunit alcohol dehydrogenase family)
VPAKVVVSDIADPARVANEIKADGGSAIAVAADVTSDDSWAALVEQSEAEFGPIEILVNNAALFAELMITPIMKMSNDEWDRVMLVNARGSFQGIKATVPSMLKNGRGKIINISSGTFYYGGPGFAHYVSSKGAILGLTRSAARELADKNIFVNCIVPGLTESEGVQNHPQLDIARAPTLQSRMLKRDMMPEDLIGALLFYATEDSDFLTGQSMNVDGGKYCQ